MTSKISVISLLGYPCVHQGDARPMASRPDAMGELEAILRACRTLYERSRLVIDTPVLGINGSVERLVKIVDDATRATFAPRET